MDTKRIQSIKDKLAFIRSNVDVKEAISPLIELAMHDVPYLLDELRKASCRHLWDTVGSDPWKSVRICNKCELVQIRMYGQWMNKGQLPQGRSL